MYVKNTRFTHISLIIIFVLSLIECVALTFCRPAIHGLEGKYYNNENWDNEPILTELDADISTATLKSRGAQLPQNRYSVEWTGAIIIPETGVYEFATNSDDGSWLWIDGNPVVDNGGTHGLKFAKGQIHLLKGLHNLKIRYFQSGGFAALSVLWATPVPHTSSLTPRMPLTAEFLLPISAPAGITAFSIYQLGQTLLPYLAGLWGILLISLGVSTWKNVNRIRQNWLEQRQIPLSAIGRQFIVQFFHRLTVQPAAYAAAQIREPSVYAWIIVIAYSTFIFLTLSYVRLISAFLTDRYGNDILSRITTGVIALTGVGILAYLLKLRGQRVSRFFMLTAIMAVYGFILSEPLRAIIDDIFTYYGKDVRLAQSDWFPLYSGEKFHLLEYGVLGILLCKALSHHIRDKIAYLIAVLLTYLVGMTDEFIQWALPNRVGEYRDVFTNLVSGVLAILVVACMIRPRVFQKTFQWSSLRPLCYVFAGIIVCTGGFLQVVHGFGEAIFMPQNGTTFVSVFSERALLELDKRYIERFEQKPTEDGSKMRYRTFMQEAQEHQHYRDQYFKNGYLFESFCEQEILKTYYRAYLRKAALKLMEYDTKNFMISVNPQQHLFYKSPAQRRAITAFSGWTMWKMIAFTASLFCLAATFFPLSFARMLREKQRDRRSGKFERYVLRPLALFCAVAAVLISPQFPFAAEKPARPNLLILTLDSSQPGYFGAYGYPKNTTPAFDRLAKEGVLFSNAITSSSWTIPSLVSMLTGVNPNIHGIDLRGKLMDPRIPTLFEALEKQGYTIGDTSYILTEPSVNSVFKKAEVSPEAAISDANSEETYLLSWLETHKAQSWMAWVHFHTVHLPYSASSPYNRMFLEGIDPAVMNDESVKFATTQLVIRKDQVVFDPPRQAKTIRALYAQVLREQDAKIEKVLMKLDELGLRDNTVIVITADHGDEVLEHGFIGHASTSWDGTAYDDLIRVPLLIAYPPQLPKGKRIDPQVRMIDLLPTLLDMLHISFDAQIQGKSLLPLIEGNADFQESVFSETSPCGYSCPKRLENDRIRSLRTNEWKLIAKYTAATGDIAYELYDLKNDPKETTDVFIEHPDIAKQLMDEMKRWMDAPSQFPYHVKKTDAPHYLDTDVEVRPIVQFPKIGSVVTPNTDNRRIHIQWIGEQNRAYIVEYDVGVGDYAMKGEIPIIGTEKWFGPLPDDIWQALPLYNPFKFRVVPKEYPQYPSDWITFEIKNGE